jgi:hypothetical protein
MSTSNVYEMTDLIEDERWLDRLKEMGAEPCCSSRDEPVADAAIMMMDLQDFLQAVETRTKIVEVAINHAEIIRSELGEALDELVAATKAGNRHAVDMCYGRCTEVLNKAFRLDALPSYAIDGLKDRLRHSSVAIAVLERAHV